MTDHEPPTVLVACAQADVREVLARVVETGGLDAVRLEAHAEVVEAVVNSRPAAVICDLGADNLAILQAMRARAEQVATSVPMILIGTGPASGRQAWRAGADGYLVRPFHARDLQDTVAEALALDDEARQARRDGHVSSSVEAPPAH